MLQLDLGKDSSVDPELAANGNNVFVVWQNRSIFWIPSGGQVFFKWSGDRGLTFSDTVVIDPDTGDSVSSMRPSVDAAGNRAHIGWWHAGELDTPPDVYSQKVKLYGPKVTVRK